MNKKLLFVGVLLSAIVTGTAFANPPIITVDEIPDMEFATFPQAYTVTGFVTHDSATGPGTKNVCRLTFFEVIVGNGTATTTLLSLTGTTTISTYFGWLPDCFETDTWSADWSILAPGIYTVVVTAKHMGASDTDDEVTLITETPVVIALCPAAPSYAAHYLQELGVKSGSKLYKNVVSLVAKHMGPTTDFDGIAACDEIPYEVAVRAFVDANRTIAK
ncbi:MAG: hypothetical protein AAB590_01910 [Patescibacteria group bacterium]